MKHMKCTGKYGILHCPVLISLAEAQRRRLRKIFVSLHSALSQCHCLSASQRLCESCFQASVKDDAKIYIFFYGYHLFFQDVLRVLRSYNKIIIVIKNEKNHSFMKRRKN